MSFWLTLPPAVQTAILVVIGACLGSAINWAVYTLAYDARPISPWAKPPAGAHRPWWSRVPVIGWWHLRTESAMHGAGFWLRPILLELGTAAFLPALYKYIVELHSLMPVGHRLATPTVEMLHAEFLSHTILIGLMLAASLIDIDEKTIPDAITVPGTLLGLALAAGLPDSLLPVLKFFREGRALPEIQAIRLTSPDDWPSYLSGFTGLWIGLGCFFWWCFALCERPWRMRRGLAVACKLFLARLVRGLTSPLMLGIQILGTAGIVATWHYGGVHWEGLLTSLAGLAIGGGLIWLVRLIGQLTLRKEAMGFGDVTLMAMLGTFLGWQACVIVFFLAPVAGLVLGLGQYFFRRENEIPYGPFLCLAALTVMLGWSALWEHVRQYFWLGWMILGILAVGFVLMGIMLLAWRFISERLLPGPTDEG